VWVTYDEGRVVLNSNGTANINEAYLKDHLGNMRVALYITGEGILKTSQVNSYYPFGMNIKELSLNSPYITKPNKYLYNGKMMQDEMGLGWYDYGARFYDPVLARWHSVDPLADQRSWVSPYSYCQNNPIIRTDPTGALDDWYMNEKTGELYYNENRSSQTTTHNNETYTRIGDNDMMGDMGKTTEKDYNNDQSQSLAQKNGYSINPTQQLEQHETKTYSDANSPAKASSESFKIINEKYGIFSSDATHKVETKKVLIENDYSFLDLLFTIGGTATVDSRSRTYSTYLNNADFKKSGSKEKEKFPAGSSVIFYKSWNDYSNKTNGKGELLIYR
jgi:RHS repeat-associated protein